MLEDVLREQVLLSLPARTLCGPDCKGLCPHCGHNLNTDPDLRRDPSSRSAVVGPFRPAQPDQLLSGKATKPPAASSAGLVQPNLRRPSGDRKDSAMPNSKRRHSKPAHFQPPRPRRPLRPRLHRRVPQLPRAQALLTTTAPNAATTRIARS